MKVALVVEWLDSWRGGAETSTLQFLHHLMDRGVEVHVFTRSRPSPAPGLHVHTVSGVDVTITGTSSINFNSIYGLTTPIPEEIQGKGFQAFGGSIDASENYWHGLSESDVREIISDSTVSPSKLGVVEILPLSTEPHPDTPDCS